MSDAYVIRYPVWMLAHEAERESKDLLNALLVLRDQSSGEQSVALFTNEELAERFVSATQMPAAPIRIDSPAVLKEWLPQFPPHGVPYVSINPVTAPGHISRRVAIGDFLAAD